MLQHINIGVKTSYSLAAECLAALVLSQGAEKQKNSNSTVFWLHLAYPFW
jgi:hypothetical protein